MRRRHHHLNATPTNLNPKKQRTKALKTRGEALPLTRTEIHYVSMIQRSSATVPETGGDPMAWESFGV
jgi:hypothetical protein